MLCVMKTDLVLYCYEHKMYRHNVRRTQSLNLGRENREQRRVRVVYTVYADTPYTYAAEKEMVILNS